LSSFFFQAEDGIRDKLVTGVQTCALPILSMCLHLFGLVAAAILTALILKIALAIKGMEKHAIKIISALESNDIKSAQHNLSLIRSEERRVGKVCRGREFKE